MQLCLAERLGHGGRPGFMGVARYGGVVRRTAESADRALVMVYGRPDAYYVTTSARSTSGLWLESGTVAVVPADSDDDVLAEAVSRAVRRPADVIPHPDRKEWPARQKQALTPILRQAHVRSWRAFVAPARLVSVAREGATCTVTPNRRNARRRDVFEQMTELATELPDFTVASLARALRAALTTAE
jgi:hypothetical protein